MKRLMIALALLPASLCAMNWEQKKREHEKSMQEYKKKQRELEQQRQEMEKKRREDHQRIYYGNNKK
jgi:Flp pilus assembly protein TadB